MQSLVAVLRVVGPITVLRLVGLALAFVGGTRLLYGLAREANAHRERWGHDFVHRAVGDGAYRGGRIAVPLLRDAPRLVRIAANLGIVVASADALLALWIAPAILMREHGTIAIVLLVGLAGPLVMLAVALPQAAFALVRCEPHALSVPPSADWSVVAHASLALTALAITSFDLPLAIVAWVTVVVAVAQSLAAHRSASLVLAARASANDRD